MANMSYCRFQNTVQDLRDCLNEMEEAIEGDGMSVDDFAKSLSKDEQYAFHRMVKLCTRIIDVVETSDEMEL